MPLKGVQLPLDDLVDTRFSKLQEVLEIIIAHLNDQDAALERFGSEVGASSERLTEQTALIEQLRKDGLASADRLAEHDARLAEHDAGLAGHDARLAEHDARLAGHDAGLAGHDARLAGHDRGLGEQLQRLETLTSNFVELSRAVDELREEVATIRAGADSTAARLGKQDAALEQLRSELGKSSERLTEQLTQGKRGEAGVAASAATSTTGLEHFQQALRSQEERLQQHAEALRRLEAAALEARSSAATGPGIAGAAQSGAGRAGPGARDASGAGGGGSGAGAAGAPGEGHSAAGTVQAAGGPAAPGAAAGTAGGAAEAGVAGPSSGDLERLRAECRRLEVQQDELAKDMGARLEELRQLLEALARHQGIDLAAAASGDGSLPARGQHGQGGGADSSPGGAAPGRAASKAPGSRAGSKEAAAVLQLKQEVGQQSRQLQKATDALAASELRLARLEETVAGMSGALGNVRNEGKEGLAASRKLEDSLAAQEAKHTASLQELRAVLDAQRAGAEGLSAGQEEVVGDRLREHREATLEEVDRLLNARLKSQQEREALQAQRTSSELAQIRAQLELYLSIDAAATARCLSCFDRRAQLRNETVVGSDGKIYLQSNLPKNLASGTPLSPSIDTTKLPSVPTIRGAHKPGTKAPLMGGAGATLHNIRVHGVLRSEDSSVGGRLTLNARAASAGALETAPGRRFSGMNSTELDSL